MADTAAVTQTPLEAAFSAIETNDAEAARARALMIAYDHRWFFEPWRCIAVEQEFNVPVSNPDTTGTSKTFTLAGKRDGLLEDQEGRLWLLEHKTTSDTTFADPGGAYWRAMSIDSQVSAYVLAAWQEGVKIYGTLYDVLRRPQLKQKKVPRKAKEGVGDEQEIENGTYFGFSVQGHGPMTDADGIETPAALMLRIARAAVDNPGDWFVRRAIPRLDSDLLDYQAKLWDVSQDLLSARRTNRWYRCDSACLRPYQCPYLSLCSGHDDESSDHWKLLESLHRELNDVDNNALTVSRIKVWEQCRRRYYYRYERGLVPAQDEDSDSLRFGSLLHRALEAWWGARI